MSNEDITKLSHEELCAEYDRAMTVFAKVIERAGGRIFIPYDAWEGEEKKVRVWYSYTERNDVIVELREQK